MDKKDEAIKLLKNVRNMAHQIEVLQEEIDKVYSMLTSTTVKPKEVDVQSSGSQDPMADRIIKMISYQEKLFEYQADLNAKKSKVLEVIKLMPVKEQELLTIRYIRGNSIERTAEILDKSYYGTWKNLNKAEDNFIELFSKVDSN